MCSRRPPGSGRGVKQRVVGNARQIVGSLFRPEAASGTRWLVRQVSLETSADFLMVRVLPLSICARPFSSPDEPIVIIDKPLNRLAGQCLSVGAPIARDAREPGLEVRR